MSQVNDDIFANTGQVQINDGQLATWSPPNQHNDAKYDFAGGAGSIQDAWYTFLTGLGYSGALSDMWAAYWAAGGGGGIEQGYSASLSNLSLGSITGTNNERFNFTTGGAGMIVSTSPLSGKLYIEVYNHYRTAANTNNIGIALNGGTWVNTQYGYLSPDVICFGGDNRTYVEGVLSNILDIVYPSQTTGAIAIDTVAGKVWFATTNAWATGHDPATGTGGETMPGLAGGSVHIIGSIPFGGANYYHILRLAATDQVYSPPAGFSAPL